MRLNASGNDSNISSPGTARQGFCSKYSSETHRPTSCPPVPPHRRTTSKNGTRRHLLPRNQRPIQDFRAGKRQKAGSDHPLHRPRPRDPACNNECKTFESEVRYRHPHPSCTPRPQDSWISESSTNSLSPARVSSRRRLPSRSTSGPAPHDDGLEILTCGPVEQATVPIRAPGPSSPGDHRGPGRSGAARSPVRQARKNKPR